MRVSEYAEGAPKAIGDSSPPCAMWAEIDTIVAYISGIAQAAVPAGEPPYHPLDQVLLSAADRRLVLCGCGVGVGQPGRLGGSGSMCSQHAFAGMVIISQRLPAWILGPVGCNQHVDRAVSDRRGV